MQAASLSSITMNMSQNISNIHSKQCDFGLKAAALCKENYPIPSCPQLRQSCCTPTLTWLFSFGIKLPSLSLKETSGCSSRSQDISNVKQYLLFKSLSSQNTWKKDHWDSL